MSASICADIFTVSVAIRVKCVLTIHENSKQIAVAGFVPRQVTVLFTYFIGTEPDATHTLFGFSMFPAIPDPATAALQDNPGWPLGIIIENVMFRRNDGSGESTPDLSGDPYEAKEALVNFSFRVDKTTYFQGNANRDNRFSFDVTIQLNTGVTPDE